MPLTLTFCVYYPLTRVFFFADDLMHLARIASGRTLTFVLAPYSGHIYHVRNLVFLAMWQLFGLHTELWYWTVLLTHLVNVWLLFRIVWSLTGRAGLACVGATLWGICPLAVGTIGFYSVYGQVMASTILLVVLDDLARLSTAGAVLTARRAGIWYALLLASTTCFGTAVGATLAFPFVLFLWLPTAWRQRGVRAAYLALPVVTLGVYFALKRLYTFFEAMPFEEALHEYLAQHGLLLAPAMLVQLVRFGIAGLSLGYFFAPERYPSVADLMSVAVFVLGLGLIGWRGAPKTRREMLAMVMLSLGTYAVIAVARANMYQTSGVQAAAFLRYHYEASIPIAIVLCLILQQIGSTRWLSAGARSFLLGAALSVMVAGYLRSKPWIDEHPITRAYFKRTTAEIENAVAAAPAGATVYVENGRTPANVIGIAFLAASFPGRAAVFLLQSPSSDLVAGRHIRFIERDPQILKMWRSHPTDPLATLLVAPEETPIPQ